MKKLGLINQSIMQDVSISRTSSYDFHLWEMSKKFQCKRKIYANMLITILIALNLCVEI